MDTEKQLMTDSQARRNSILNTIQHFDTNAEDFSDFLFNVAVDDFTASIPVINKSIQEFFTCSEDLDTGMKKLVKRFYDRLERNSEKLEKYLEEVIFNTSDEPSKSQVLNDICDNNELEISCERIENLKRKLAALRKEKEEILENVKELDAVELRIKTSKQTADHLSDCFNKCKITSLLNIVACTKQQITGIRNDQRFNSCHNST